MASPSASTPSSAGSPAAFTSALPALAMKSSNVESLGSPLAAGSMHTGVTTKEWVIPPRPKSGRKPATDTPPTKRKAQNRAAQRAFRERRAARVGELEDQLEETKEEQQKREADLRNKITRLEMEVQKFTGEINSWRLRCQTLDRMVDYEKREKDAALTELAYLRNGASNTGADAIPLPPRHLRHQNNKYSQSAQEPSPQSHYTLPATLLDQSQQTMTGCGSCMSSENCACVDRAVALAASGCGKCTIDTHCECLEDTVREAAQAPSLELKRSHSPPVEQISKRHRQTEAVTPLEVDFTTQFGSNPTKVNPLETPATPLGDSCGFCEEGTYCMCAEAAATADSTMERHHENQLPPLLNEVTPPPSDTDVERALAKLPSLQPNHMHRPVAPIVSASPCAAGPGTCQQCQTDPRSGIFCRSLAAIRKLNNAPQDGCCGGNADGGGCCKSTQSAPPPQAPPSLSCADAYKTLSTHKGFDQATDELNTWLGRLHASPPAHPGRAPMEVEAASVMGVLKFFDRRFGRG